MAAGWVFHQISTLWQTSDWVEQYFDLINKKSIPIEGWESIGIDFLTYL